MEGDYSHHLGPPDSFAEPPLRPPCKLCLRSACDTSHIGHKVREEGGVEGLPKGVDAELVENVFTTGFFSGRTKIRTLEDYGFFCSTFHRERSRGDRLSGRRESPLRVRVHAGNGMGKP